MLLVPSHMEVIKEGVVSSKNALSAMYTSKDNLTPLLYSGKKKKNALNISRTRACVQIHKHHVSEKRTLLPQCENFVICLATK